MFDFPHTCLTCGRALSLTRSGNTDECCGLVYRYTKEGNWENLRVYEKKHLLHRLAIPITIGFLAAAVTYFAYSIRSVPRAIDIAFSFGLVAFEFGVVFLIVKETFEWYRLGESRPVENNNLARIMLISAAATFLIACGIINGWLSSGECIETRFYSTC